MFYENVHKGVFIFAYFQSFLFGIFAKYQFWFTDNKEHFVECLLFPVSGSADFNNVLAVYVDGKPIDSQALTFESVRTSTDYYKNKCRGSALDTSYLIGVHMGSYGSKDAPTVKGTKPRTLLMVFNIGYFSTYHMMKVYNKSDWPNTPDSYISGTDQFHQEYYQGTWNQHAELPMGFVLDIDQKGQCIDLFSPNWFYGSEDRFGVGNERPSFVENIGLGKSILPPYLADEN